ncbi:MAG: imidazole glycerol phosphate synthase subunit HisH [Nitrososphaeria archaeon]
MKIIIYNYGASNLYSIYSALKRLNEDTKVVERIDSEKQPDLLVLPGVGNFSQASKSLKDQKESIVQMAREGTFVLGICLGLHMFYEKSEEGEGEGLGILRGTVTKLNRGKVPHMGWSYTELLKENYVWKSEKKGDWFYYAHSYYVPGEERFVYAMAENSEIKIPALIIKENFIGVQFHPEKSGESGLMILKGVLEAVKK